MPVYRQVEMRNDKRGIKIESAFNSYSLKIEYPLLHHYCRKCNLFIISQRVEEKVNFQFPHYALTGSAAKALSISFFN